MKKILLIVSFLMLFHAAQGQNSLSVRGMVFHYELMGDSLLITVEAPTTGWLAVGFNHENSILKCDLKMVRVVNGVAQGEDRFNDGTEGSYPPDVQQNGRNNLVLVNGYEADGETKICFKIPLQSNDSKDFKLKPNETFWLILAYSQQDDFEHHSVMREHLEFLIR